MEERKQALKHDNGDYDRMQKHLKDTLDRKINDDKHNRTTLKRCMDILLVCEMSKSVIEKESLMVKLVECKNKVKSRAEAVLAKPVDDNWDGQEDGILAGAIYRLCS